MLVIYIEPHKLTMAVISLVQIVMKQILLLIMKIVLISLLVNGYYSYIKEIVIQEKLHHSNLVNVKYWLCIHLESIGNGLIKKMKYII